jgi:hypothetical protein
LNVERAIDAALDDAIVPVLVENAPRSVACKAVAFPTNVPGRTSGAGIASAGRSDSMLPLRSSQDI